MKVMESKMRASLKKRKLIRIIMLVAFVVATAGAGTMTAYAHGQQGDDCPKGSTDPDCQKK
jgi:flagellar basal body-associated protein FliL